jgi:hypothetical protein
MADISFLQEIDGGADSSSNSTNRTAQYTSNISASSILLVCLATRDNSPTNIAISDDKSNTWTRIDSEFETGSGRGCAAYYAIANGASVGAKPIITFNKAGASCVLCTSILELANVHADIFDTVSVSSVAVSSGPAQATLGTTVFTNDAVMAVLAMEQTGWATATPLTGYTDSVSNNTSGGFLQHKVLKRLTTSAAAYTPGWSLSQSSHWAVIAFAFKGNTTLPTIVSVSSTTPRKNSTLTITGVNFGSSTGTVTLGGTSLTVTAWSSTSISATVSEGTNKFGVAASLSITTAASVTSNTLSTITEILPQTGWDFIDLITPDLFTDHRLTAVGDLEEVDQVSYDTASGLVNVSNTGIPDADPSVTSFGARAWTPGSGWGSTGTQTISTDDYEVPDDTIVIGGHKASAQLIIPGVNNNYYKVIWSDLLDGEKGAPAAIDGITSMSFAASGDFGDGGYVPIEGSDDGISYSALLDAEDNPILLDSTAVFTSTDVRANIRAGTVVGDADTDLKVVMIAT